MSKKDRSRKDANSLPTVCIDERRFVVMWLMSMLLPWRWRVSWKRVEQVRRRLLMYLQQRYSGSEYTRREQAVLAQWETVRWKLRKNWALVQFMLEYGVYSEFFYVFLLNIPGAVTLEAASGYGYDVLGEMRKIPPEDAMYPFCVQDEMFCWIRRRIVGEQYFLKKAKRILFAGGGLLQSLRRNGYVLDGKQEIVAFDYNTDLKAQFKDVFAKPLSEYGIKFICSNISWAFCERKYERYFDVIDASGVLSYRESEQELRHMLAQMLKMLAPGGKIVFDLQVMRYTLLFDMMLGWKTKPRMKPEGSVGEAVTRVRKICETLGAEMQVVACEKIGVQFAVSNLEGNS